jgi:hypothetical protein
VRFRQVTNLSQSLNNVEDPLELPAKLDTLAAGAWAHDYPDLDEPLSLLHEKCPRLLNSFVPTSEHNKTEVEDEDALDVLEVMEDGGLTQARLSSKGFRLNVPAAILSVCDPPYPPDLVALTSKPLKWYQRLAYTEPASDQRRVNNVDDYIVTRRVAGRLAQCFTMVFRNRPAHMFS